MLWTLFKILKFAECMCVEMVSKKESNKIYKKKSVYYTFSTNHCTAFAFLSLPGQQGRSKVVQPWRQRGIFTLSNFSTWHSIIKTVDLVSGQSTQQFFLFQSDDNAVVQLDTFPDYGTNSFMRDSQVSQFCLPHTRVFFPANLMTNFFGKKGRNLARTM